MAKLILKYEASVVREIPLQKALITIGRAPGNDVVIDNPAVSSQHAKLRLQEGGFLLEDLESLNGTFLNNQRIRQSPLKDGDAIMIGKHTLEFQAESEAGNPAAGDTDEAGNLPGAGLTFVLDTKQRREFLAKATSIAVEGATTANKVGCLLVLKGKTSHKEYILTSNMSVIGKDSGATVHLKHWFSPRVAAVITRRGDHYEIAPSEAKTTQVNFKTLVSPQELNQGDVIRVGRVHLQFFFRE